MALNPCQQNLKNQEKLPPFKWPLNQIGYNTVYSTINARLKHNQVSPQCRLREYSRQSRSEW